ncbi:hypothetical protein O3P69_009339 [Scylla paramamosain]|uniref:Uncharacterized protein n=1 Tax=Scylla paramamosain TaxID=85552 RepID=A0AAW0T9Y4_SCYPA
MPTILSVVAHGPSRWLTGHPPENCRFQKLRILNYTNWDRCIHPPSTTSEKSSTPKLTLEKIMIITTSAAGVVAVGVMVMVVFYWKWKAVISPRPATLSPPPDQHVIENDIYEPFDGDANDAAPQTFQNDLYESFSGHERRRDT